MTERAADGALRRPLYDRVLRLRHVRLSRWQRLAVSDGMVLLAVIVVLADLASLWLLVALPVAVAVVVKLHDVLAGLLAEDPAAPAAPTALPGQPRRGDDGT